MDVYAELQACKREMEAISGQLAAAEVGRLETPGYCFRLALDVRLARLRPRRLV